MPMGDLLGTTLAGYHLQGALGHGAMAQLYRGVGSDGSVAALKVMRPELCVQPDLVERFQRELESTACIEHPNVVRVLGSGRVRDRPYLVLEFLEGTTLAQRLRRGAAIDPTEACRIGHQLALGLAAAHARNVVHRDLKPDNVMQLADGTVRLFDFGLSAPEGTRSARLTAQDLRIGTPHYMAPEYIRTGAIDQRSDLYGLGVLLFELLTAQTPFRGPPYKVMHAKISRPAPRAGSVRPLPARLDDLIAALLERAPEDRPPSAAHIATALAGFTDDSPADRRPCTSPS